MHHQPGHNEHRYSQVRCGMAAARLISAGLAKQAARAFGTSHASMEDVPQQMAAWLRIIALCHWLQTKIGCWKFGETLSTCATSLLVTKSKQMKS